MLLDNQKYVTPDLLDLVERAIGFLEGMPTGGFNATESSKIADTLKAIVAHERVLQAGLASKLIFSIDKVRNRPVEVAAIALFL